MKSEPSRVTGGCLCRRIRYEAEVFLHSGYLCHCTICQKSTGQPAELTVLIKAGTLRYLTEEPSYFVSSDFGKRGFCRDCGSRIVWQATDPEMDWTTNLSIGGLDRPEEARMACHIFVDTQLPWYQPCPDLPRFAEAELVEMMRFIRQD
jgi:hypothetical protein